MAGEIGRSPPQVALAWAVAQPGVTSALIGASTVAQLEDNLAALDITLTTQQLQALNAIGSPGMNFSEDARIKLRRLYPR